MDRISKALKCANCQLILNSPVLLQCGHSICKYHAQFGDWFLERIGCDRCGVEHKIPNEGLPDNQSLAEIISTQVHTIKLGEAHDRAKQDFDRLESLIDESETILNDPFHHVFKEIDQIKSEVQLKREELKMKIDLEIENFMGKLDQYVHVFRLQLNSSEQNRQRSSDMQEKRAQAIEKSKSFKHHFNQVMIDDEFWSRISDEIGQNSRQLSELIDEFKHSLVVSGLEELKIHSEFISSLDIDFNFISR